MKKPTLWAKASVLLLSVAASKTAATDGNLQHTENNGLYSCCLVAAFFVCQREELYRGQINACQKRGCSFQRVKRLNTREPSFYGNSGNKATASNHAAYSVALVIREVATKATHIFIYLWSCVSCCHLKKGWQQCCHNNYLLNQSVRPCCLVATNFAIYRVELYRGRFCSLCEHLPVVAVQRPHPPSWQALFSLLPFSQPWGFSSTTSPCTPTAQWRA